MANGCEEVVVENGGDIFISRKQDATISIFAGESPLSYKVGVCLSKEQMPLGVCTSSGKIGHSLSFGVADSVTVIAKSTMLADAAATRLGNEVKSGGELDIERTLNISQKIQGICGTIVISGGLMGAIGDIKLVKLD